ncbi:hypothetical protein Y919_04230 [Caloranaerobacter azorensis H53214]|uniref:Uncharacterized protein n=1 Tax=Caloranaerobacter azorensis H53214 TaxID=1156417 RepID=A0A096BJ70_9FIRM|nr:hypothetical protein [Caloranaerobacter azorensis]KGG80803.1 hypothetical protein Y919_04230 [Caloranaerobacter azorensis H53214]
MNSELGNNNGIKNLEEILEKFKGKIEVKPEQLEELRELANKYSNKTEEELMLEVMKYSKIFSKDMTKKEYMDKIKKLEKIKPFLNEEQAEKLDKLVEILKKVDVKE